MIPNGPGRGHTTAPAPDWIMTDPVLIATHPAGADPGERV